MEFTGFDDHYAQLTKVDDISNIFYERRLSGVSRRLLDGKYQVLDRTRTFLTSKNEGISAWGSMDPYKRDILLCRTTLKDLGLPINADSGIIKQFKLGRMYDETSIAIHEDSHYKMICGPKTALLTSLLIQRSFYTYPLMSGNQGVAISPQCLFPYNLSRYLIEMVALKQQEAYLRKTLEDIKKSPIETETTIEWINTRLKTLDALGNESSIGKCEYYCQHTHSLATLIQKELENRFKNNINFVWKLVNGLWIEDDGTPIILQPGLFIFAALDLTDEERCSPKKIKEGIIERFSSLDSLPSGGINGNLFATPSSNGVILDREKALKHIENVEMIKEEDYKYMIPITTGRLGRLLESMQSYSVIDPDDNLVEEIIFTNYDYAATCSGKEINLALKIFKLRSNFFRKIQFGTPVKMECLEMDECPILKFIKGENNMKFRDLIFSTGFQVDKRQYTYPFKIFAEEKGDYCKEIIRELEKLGDKYAKQ